MAVNAHVEQRQRRTKLDDLLTYNGPLADSEQEEFVGLMESEAVSHCQRWQTVMAVLSLTLATLMCVAGVRQFLHPWDLRHHAFFHGAVSSMWVAMGELLSGASYALSGCLFLSQMSLSHGSQTGSAGERLCQKGKSTWSLPGVTVAFGALNALFWVYAMYKALQVHSSMFMLIYWQDFSIQVHTLPVSSLVIYSWLPLGPAAYALLSCQVAAMLAATLEDAQKLRHQMYILKSV